MMCCFLSSGSLTPLLVIAVDGSTNTLWEVEQGPKTQVMSLCRTICGHFICIKTTSILFTNGNTVITQLSSNDSPRRSDTLMCFD